MKARNHPVDFTRQAKKLAKHYARYLDALRKEYLRHNTSLYRVYRGLRWGHCLRPPFHRLWPRLRSCLRTRYIRLGDRHWPRLRSYLRTRYIRLGDRHDRRRAKLLTNYLRCVDRLLPTGAMLRFTLAGRTHTVAFIGCGFSDRCGEFPTLKFTSVTDDANYTMETLLNLEDVVRL
jgi:hypothetical protein